MKMRAWPAVAALATSLAIPAFAQDNREPVKVAVIQDSTGPLQPYAEQMITGFKLGLEYGTKGTGMAGGRKIEVI
jgi:branched-chain amino acid transport system substrate-binding protein